MNESYRKVFGIIGAIILLLGVILLIASLPGFLQQTLTTPLLAIILGMIFLSVGSGVMSKTK